MGDGLAYLESGGTHGEVGSVDDKGISQVWKERKVSKLTNGDWKAGDLVLYDNGVIKGEGFVMGVATLPMATIGASIIVEDLSGNLPIPVYPFKFFVCFENQLTKVAR